MVPPERIDGLTPRGDGHAFVFYGDSCSGVPGATHEATLAATNAAVAALDPAPDFVIFAGDEIVGLTADEHALRAQWRHWLDEEMGWLDRTTTPLYHTTSNHTTYNSMSERVFADVLPHLPRNGPADQQGLTYFVRRDDLLLVFVNTCTTGLGGEGFVETEWLDAVLVEHADAARKLVIGHHPVHPVNGLSGEYQREVGRDIGQRFWGLLTRHRVDAYLCSHILAFDVQVHDGVLQVLSAGAGTAHRMPPETEYLHFVQAAIDGRGLRYEVIDQEGRIRERLSWPPQLPPSNSWSAVDETAMPTGAGLVVWRFRGSTPVDDGDGSPQTLVAVPSEDPAALSTVWVGLTGTSMRLTVTVGPAPGRSPHYWFGPELEAGATFDLQLLLHPDMGPGGLLHRWSDDQPWSSLRSASPWGLEVLRPPFHWTGPKTSGLDVADETVPPFRGANLEATWFEGELGT